MVNALIITSVAHAGAGGCAVAIAGAEYGLGDDDGIRRDSLREPLNGACHSPAG